VYVGLFTELLPGIDLMKPVTIIIIIIIIIHFNPVHLLKYLKTTSSQLQGSAEERDTQISM
jgi:hypothetical protein